MPITALVLESRLLRDIAPGNVERFYEVLSEADEKLLEAGKWSWTRRPLDLTPTNGIVSLPGGYTSIVGCKVGSMAKGVLWQEIEFLEHGPGVIPVEGCSGQLLDIGVIEGVRQYRCTGSDPQDIVVLARYAPSEITGPFSIPRCQSFSAIKNAMLSLIYEGASDPERGRMYFQMALETLSNQEVAYRGSAKKVFDPKIYGPPRRRTSTNFP